MTPQNQHHRHENHEHQHHEHQQPGHQHHGRKTFLFIAITVLANSFGNLLLALGMDRMPAFGHVPFASYLIRLVATPALLLGAALTAVYTLTQLSLFSWADLSFVIPCTASSYVLTTFFGQVFMREHVSWVRWVGVVLISVGVTFVAKTPETTKERPARVTQC